MNEKTVGIGASLFARNLTKCLSKNQNENVHLMINAFSQSGW